MNIFGNFNFWFKEILPGETWTNRIVATEHLSVESELATVNSSQMSLEVEIWKGTHKNQKNQNCQQKTVNCPWQLHLLLLILMSWHGHFTGSRGKHCSSGLICQRNVHVAARGLMAACYLLSDYQTVYIQKLLALCVLQLQEFVQTYRIYVSVQTNNPTVTPRAIVAQQPGEGPWILKFPDKENNLSYRFPVKPETRCVWNLLLVSNVWPQFCT